MNSSTTQGVVDLSDPKVIEEIKMQYSNSDLMKRLEEFYFKRTAHNYFPDLIDVHDACRVAATTFMVFRDSADILNAYINYMKYTDKIRKGIKKEQLMRKQKYVNILHVHELLDSVAIRAEYVNDYANRVAAQQYFEHPSQEDLECGILSVSNMIRNMLNDFFNEFAKLENEMKERYNLYMNDSMKFNFNDNEDFVKWTSYADWC